MCSSARAGSRRRRHGSSRRSPRPASSKCRRPGWRLRWTSPLRARVRPGCSGGRLKARPSQHRRTLMADVSIANLPALVGNGAPTDLLVLVDISDTSESPLGTTKRATFTQAMNTQAGPVTVNGELRVSGPVAGPRDIALQTNGSTRWRIRPNTNLETGGNAGSDLAIDALADDGTTQIFQYFFRRSTGDAEFPHQVGISVPANFSGALLNVGADAGGHSIRGSGQITANGAMPNDAVGIFVNPDPVGYGLSVQGGGGGRYALNVLDQPGTTLFTVTTALTAMKSTAVVIGTDPGGPQILRVGGAVNITGGVLMGGPLSVATINGPLVIGADPGGSQFLRVGGDAHVLALVVTSNFNGSGIASFNTATNGFGILSKGGGIGGNFVAQFQDVNNNVCLSVIEPSVLTNTTSLIVRCSFVAGTPQVGFAQVLIGPSGSGPGGSGRALYVAL